MLCTSEPIRQAYRSALDTCESVARVVSEVEWSLARSAGVEPLSSWLAVSADATRDATAIQLSALRWLLDV
jgi:hypothetical protein